MKLFNKVFSGGQIDKQVVPDLATNPIADLHDEPLYLCRDWLQARQRLFLNFIKPQWTQTKPSTKHLNKNSAI